MNENRDKIHFEDIPEFQRNRLAKSLLEACRKFYSDPKNVEKFEKWKAEKAKNN